MRRSLMVSALVAAVTATWTTRLTPRAKALAVRTATSKAALNISKFDPAHDPKFVHFDCGTSVNSHASDDLLAAHQALHRGYAGTGAPGSILRTRKRDVTTIPTYIHVVTTTAKTGTIPATAPQAQIDALNTAYASAGFHFTLAGSEFTTNDIWAVGAADADVAVMKTALRKGSYSTLNLYFQTDLAGSILGVCSMPSNVSDPNNPTATIDPSTYSDDGCQINAGTMPGGSIYGYSAGMTAVHETGHWLGLFHVFEGYACDGDGDLIADTPPQMMATDGCPVSPPQDSCPGDVWTAGMPMPGGVNVGDAMVDAVHNNMDYSTDACYTGFTPLQMQRMVDLWGLYRAGR